MSSHYLVGLTLSTSTSQYVVESLLGKGSFGAVALCRKLPRERVAVKFIDASIPIEKAKKEAQILRHLTVLGSKDFHIVDFHDSFTFNGHFCIELEKLDINLFSYRSLQPLTLSQIRPIIKQVAEALCFLGDADVVHTDVKPENIMLVDRRRQPLRIKIIDFGEAVRKPLRWAGDQMQSLAFRAPEVMLGAPLSQAVDVWSFGCVAVELLTGTALFSGKTLRHMMRLIVTTIGMPPNYFLDMGCYTETYFVQQRSHVWTPRTKDSRCPRHVCPCPFTSLDAILKLPQEISAEEAESERTCYVDLVVKMLNLDAFQRIKPKDILQHPFLTTCPLTASCSRHSSSQPSEPKRKRSNSPSEKRERSDSPLAKRKRSDLPSEKRKRSDSLSAKRQRSYSPSHKRKMSEASEERSSPKKKRRREEEDEDVEEEEDEDVEEEEEEDEDVEEEEDEDVEEEEEEEEEEEPPL